MGFEESQVTQQRDYYAKTAAAYERLHVRQEDEHFVALAWLGGLLRHHDVTSVLDVGSGTGRALRYIKQHYPDIRVVGIEPSAELRAVGHASGLSQTELCDGDATRLGYESGSFDLVCEFGILHHIAKPRSAVREMLRVARTGIFISDDNHFGNGSSTARLAKRALNFFGLWKSAYLLRTGGKGYRISEGDGLSYPYSVFEDLPTVQAECSLVSVMNTRGRGPDLFSTASHVALFGRKK